MHEISLVQNLIQQLKELAAANKSSRIITVTMEIGPLAGVVGVILGRKEKKSRLVVSVELFQRSVAVELDSEAIERWS